MFLSSTSNSDDSGDNIIEDYTFKGISWKTATRVQLIKQHLISRGYNPTISKMIAQSQSQGSLGNYENKWKRYITWCIDNQSHPIYTTDITLSKFILYLFELGRSTSTVRQYLASISTATELITGKKWGDSKTLHNIIKYNARRLNKLPTVIPTWDLSVVLDGLSNLNNRATSLDSLLYKTSFLLTLAAGARRGEVHAWLVTGLEHDVNWTYVTIKASDTFIAKTHNVITGQGAYKPITILSLPRKEGEKRSQICPVGTLRTYLTRAQPLRKNRVKLLISVCHRCSQEIKVNTISRWVKKGIEVAYLVQDKSLTGHKYCAHQVRGKAASVAYAWGVPLPRVLKAGRWRRETTFTKFYLKDISKRTKDWMKLKPLIAMQEVIGSSTGGK